MDVKPKARLGIATWATSNREVLPNSNSVWILFAKRKLDNAMPIHQTHHTIDIGASAEDVWREVTHVDVTAFRLPRVLGWMGIPKPMRSEIHTVGLQRERVAHFSNGCKFHQRITRWEPLKEYAFTFHTEPGFRVGYVLDLATGPFRIKDSAYRLEQRTEGTRVILTGSYELHGFGGWCLTFPVKVILSAMQRFLLNGIKKNAERRGKPNIGLEHEDS